MDIDDAKRVKRRLREAHDSIQTIVNSTNAVISGVPQYWQGDSARLFMQRYQNSISKINAILRPLRKIASDLDDEIDRMERIAERF